MNLSTTEKGNYKVVKVIAGIASRTRLAHLGVLPNEPIEKISEQRFTGPVLIKVKGTTLSIGRELAKKVIVE